MRVARVCIYPQDVQRITGRAERSARKLLQLIREDLGKGRNQFVTVSEFADYTGIPEEKVAEYIQD